MNIGLRGRGRRHDSLPQAAPPIGFAEFCGNIITALLQILNIGESLRQDHCRAERCQRIPNMLKM